MVRKIVVVTMLSLFLLQLSGCAGIQNDSNRTRAEGTGTGAAGGAAIGALIGQLVGGDTAGTLIGAGIGAITGAVGGYIYGNHVATQKEKYAKEEDWLDACLVEVRGANEIVAAYNKSLQQEITFLKKEKKNILAIYTDKKKQKEKMVVAKKEINKQKKSAEKALAAAKAEHETQSSVAVQAKESGQKDYAEDLDSEIEVLEASIKELEASTDELASMSAGMAV